MLPTRHVPLRGLLILMVGVLAGSAQEIDLNSSRRSESANRQALPGVNSTALRQNAFEQKLRMRSLRASSQSVPGIGGVWVSLGPLPLPSDASGSGDQDYGWVTGRATAIAIDPNDPTTAISRSSACSRS